MFCGEQWAGVPQPAPRPPPQTLVLTKRRAADSDAAALERVAAAEASLAAERAARSRDAASAEQAAEELRLKNEAEKEAYVAEFRGQLKTREEELRNMEAIHAAVRRQWEQRIAELEGKLARLREAHRALEYRRALDIEGFGADVTLLRKQAAALDRRLTAARLADRLDDGSRLDGLLETLARRASPSPPSAPGARRPDSAGRLAAGQGSVSDVARELAGLRAQLAASGERLAQAARDARRDAEVSAQI